jgi:hypothetical protein
MATTEKNDLIAQGWIGVAVWMTLGLLLEGLIGYRAPSYLEDAQRRELFRLAHAHGAALNSLLVLAGLTLQQLKGFPKLAALALRVGSLLMPLGFLLAGLSHPEGDPGLGIWLVPPGALLMIFGIVALAISWNKGRAG